ncbi:50S ribosomal protein L4 [Mycoplasma corogypsi]|uniref:50S ribosomal protein L4 n=1 Tax=Mycoplasma corogypsi TaxID=2106 RepID=UPI0038732AAE
MAKANKANVNIVNEKVAKTVEFKAKLPASLFASEKIYEQAIFDTIISDRASRRQGTHKVKNRAEVSGTGKKPWKQKGTGRARAGSLRSPVFVGGGRAFGPKPNRNYTLKVNKKVRYAAFVSALTMLAEAKAVAVEDFKLAKPSTKELVESLTKLNVMDLKRVLVVTEDVNVFLSARNLKNVTTTKANSLSVEQLLGADVMILSSESLKLIEGRAK